MEKKTIAMLAVSAVILILGIVFACGIGRGGELTYQRPSPYTAERSNDYSDVQVAMTIQGNQILDAEITSSGDNDLLTDELRAQWADSIVASQSYENDVISSATLKYSADSVKEAAADIFTQAGLPTPEPAATPEPEPEPEPVAEAPAGDAGTLADGNFHVEKTTDFSTIDVGITVDGSRITDASVTSAALEGQVDMLTDDIRSAWASQIVEKQAVDAVSGVTVSSDAVQEAVEQLMVQVNGGADAAGLNDGTYTIEKTTDFSTINVELTVEGGKVTAARVASEGANDLLTDDQRAAWADQIIEKQGVDVVSGVTVSSNAVQEAVDELMAQAASGSEAAADDGRIAELEAALAEANARAEAAEAKAAELESANAAAEAKVAELEAANAAAETKAAELEAAAAAAVATTEPADISRFVRPRPSAAAETTETETEVEEAAEAEVETEVTAASEPADVSRFMRSRPGAATETTETEAEEAVETEVEEATEAGTEEAVATEPADVSRFVRPRPGAAAETTEAEPETEVEEAAESEIEEVAATEPADVSRFVRPRPSATTVTAEPEAEEAAVTEPADISRFMRSRPGTVAETTEPEAETEAKEAAEPETEEATTTEPADVSRFVRPRPGAAAETTEAEPETEEVATTEPADFSRFMRPRPGTAA